MLAAAQLRADDTIHGSTYKVLDLAPGVHSVIWNTPVTHPAIGNSTFIINDRDVVVVDAGISRKSAEAILGEIRKRTALPVTAVIHTHSHTDHTLGAFVFQEAFPNAAFIAHPATQREIAGNSTAALKKNVEEAKAAIAELEKATPTDATRAQLAERRLELDILASGPYVPPNTLVDDNLVLLRGKRRIEIRFLGLGNTDGDLVVWLPEEKIAITGDLALTPVPFATDSYITAWPATLDRLVALGATTYVPGHWEPQHDPQFIADVQSLLRQLRDQVQAGIAAGKTAEDLKKSVKLTLRPESPIAPKLARPGFAYIFTNPAVENAYKELTKPSS